MGNYRDLESEFIERTLRLIDQYHGTLDKYEFQEQFNYTLTVNCMLGLIVMPKEKVINFVPITRLTKDFLTEIGAPSLEVGGKISTLRDLIRSLRHAVAHFDISVISEDDQNRIDWLEFSDSENGGELVAKFRAHELLPFLRCYANYLLQNMANHRR